MIPLHVLAAGVDLPHLRLQTTTTRPQNEGDRRGVVSVQGATRKDGMSDVRLLALGDTTNGTHEKQTPERLGHDRLEPPPPLCGCFAGSGSTATANETNFGYARTD